MPGQTHIIPIILGVQCCLGRASGQGSGASSFGGGIGRRLPTAWQRLAAMVLGRQHIHVICRRYSASLAGGYWGVSSIVWWRRAAVARQKNNSTTKAVSMNDRWRSRIATNRSRRWRSGTMYGRLKKTDASSFVVIMIFIIGEGQGGRGPRKERGKTTRLSPTNDDGDARLQWQRQWWNRRPAYGSIPIDPSALCATRLCHLGGAFVRRSLPWRLRCQASSVVVGGVKFFIPARTLIGVKLLTGTPL